MSDGRFWPSGAMHTPTLRHAGRQMFGSLGQGTSRFPHSRGSLRTPPLTKRTGPARSTGRQGVGQWPEPAVGLTYRFRRRRFRQAVDTAENRSVTSRAQSIYRPSSRRCAAHDNTHTHTNTHTHDAHTWTQTHRL